MKRDDLIEKIIAELESDGAYFQEVGGCDGFVNGIIYSLDMIERMYKIWQEKNNE